MDYPSKSPFFIILLSLILGVSSNILIPTSYASLGDSYAAGDGAGTGQLWCGRFSESYPAQIASDDRLNISPWKFKDLSCGGASSVSVLKGQMPLIGTSDLVTITVGGNEADFFPLLNECIHQWHPKSSCAEAVIRARTAIQSASFIDNFEKMIAGGMRRKRSDAQLFVTGYARFFNDETDQCNSVSFSKSNPSNVLTKQLRRGLNDLVVMLNDVIEAIATAQGAIYVDIDQIFESHRFCEDGVIEPAPERPETWFFNVHLGTSNAGLNVVQLPSQKVLLDRPKPIKDFFDLTKTFHPTSLGHAAIADEIVRLVLKQN